MSVPSHIDREHLPATTRAILALLEEHTIEFRFVEHGPTRTCEESAAARGEPQSIGGKSLLLKVGPDFVLCVLSASARLDANAVRRLRGQSGARFAKREELAELTGLEPGSVPPFGPPILPVPLLVDEGLLENDRIAFNAGSLEHSVVMPMAPYLDLARPTLGRFSKSPT